MSYSFSPREQMEYDFNRYKQSIDELETEVNQLRSDNNILANKLMKLEVDFDNLLTALIDGAEMPDQTRSDIVKIQNEE